MPLYFENLQNGNDHLAVLSATIPLACPGPLQQWSPA